MTKQQIKARIAKLKDILAAGSVSSATRARMQSDLRFMNWKLRHKDY